MARTHSMRLTGNALWTLPLALTLAISGCGTSATTSASTSTDTEAAATSEQDASTKASTERETISDDADNSHAITASGEQSSYTAVDVTKTGDADGDEADFYGTNAAVYAEEGATLDLDDITVTTDGTHANAVFSYG